MVKALPPQIGDSRRAAAVVRVEFSGYEQSARAYRYIKRPVLAYEHGQCDAAGKGGIAVGDAVARRHDAPGDVAIGHDLLCTELELEVALRQSARRHGMSAMGRQ